MLKVFPVLRCLAIITTFLLAGAHCVLAQQDPMPALEAFRKKLEASASKEQGGGENYGRMMTTLESKIRGGQYEYAEQMLDSIQVPASLASEWATLSKALTEYLATKESSDMAAWRTAVDQMAADAHAACLSAKTSSELDALLIHCAPLQKRDQRYQGAIAERIRFKITGVAMTLSALGKYLDLVNTGNAKAANEVIAELSQNGANEFPLLTQDELKARLVPLADTELSLADRLNKFSVEYTTPNELPAVIEQLKGIAADPSSRDRQNIESQIKVAEILLASWELAKTNQVGAMTKSLAQMDRLGLNPTLTPFYENMRGQILFRMLESAAPAWTKTKPDPAQDAISFLEQTLRELKAAGNFQAMLDVLDIAKILDNRSGNEQLGFTQERYAIEKYLAAQRFISVGDNRMAVVYLREVIGASGSKYAPTDKAVEELKAIFEKHRELANEPAPARTAFPQRPMPGGMRY